MAEKNESDGQVTPFFEIEDPVAAKVFFDKNKIAFQCRENDDCVLDENFEQVYLWQQKFKPGLNAIDVKYPPVVGGDYFFSPKDKSILPQSDDNYTIDREIHHGFGFAPWDMRNASETFREYFCIDDATEAAMDRIINKDKEMTLSGFSVVYIWDTARYWSGPIKKFHLIIEKESPQQIASYCPYVGKKTSPTRFEWETENFVPQGVLRVFYFPVLPE